MMSVPDTPTFYLSKDNYLNYEIDAKNNFIVDFEKFKTSNFSFKWHCLQATLQICKDYPNPYLAVSGGVDSQAMLLSFVESQQDFQIVFFRYTDQSKNKFFNEYDYNSLISFIEAKNIIRSIKIIDIDLDNFYRSPRFFDMSNKYQCSSPQLIVHIYALSLLDRPFVLAWNLPNIYKFKSHNYIHVPDFKYFSIQRFLKLENKPGVPYFFIYSPEQFYTSLMIPDVRRLFFINFPHSFSMSYTTKVQAYHTAGFEVIAQDKKRTGFEEYKIHYQHSQGSILENQFELNLRKPLEFLLPNIHTVCIRMDSEFFKNHVLK